MGQDVQKGVVYTDGPESPASPTAHVPGTTADRTKETYTATVQTRPYRTINDDGWNFAASQTTTTMSR